VVANVVVPTADYVRFAGHYGFRPGWCEAGDPASKGIVEHLCGYAQSDLVVPLLTEAQVSGVPVSLPAANAAAAAWCAEVNAAVHSEIAAVPDERLGAERELLAPLPSLRPEIGAASVTRKVDRLSCVRYGSARYSVPTRLIGATVNIVIDHGALLVVEPGTGAIVAEHELVAPGEMSILDEHNDGPRPMPSRGPRPKTTVEQQFCALGEDAQAFLVGAAAIGNTRLGSELEILLGLRAAHGQARHHIDDQLGVLPGLILRTRDPDRHAAVAHVEHAEHDIAVTDEEVPERVAHRRRPVAAAAGLVEHHRTMAVLQSSQHLGGRGGDDDPGRLRRSAVRRIHQNSPTALSA
jgi:hypothetical protein